MNHIWHKCRRYDCHICEGGLAYCVVCRGFEGSLLTYCPGFMLNEDTLKECYHGKIKDLHHFRTMVQHGAKIINGELVWNKG